MPIPPTVILSLGATAPSLPSAELGMIVGAITAAPAESADFNNCRRLRCAFVVDITWSPDGVGRWAAWTQFAGARGSCRHTNSILAHDKSFHTRFAAIDVRDQAPAIRDFYVGTSGPPQRARGTGAFRLAIDPRSATVFG